MKTRFTHASFNYTGGGIYVFIALYNNEVWFATDFLCNDAYGFYDVHPDQIEADLTPAGFINYDGHWKNPSCQLPTWCEVVMAIDETFGKAQGDIARKLIETHDIGINWIVGSRPTPEEEANSARLEIVGEFMDVVLDYLEGNGIPHDHDDLCGYLSEHFETLLTEHGVLKGA